VRGKTRNGTVRVAVAGCGGVVETGHAPAYREATGIEVVALCDLAEKRRTIVGDLLGVPEAHRFATLSSFATMAAPPNVVVVATPTATHSAVISHLLRHGFHVVSEKPISPAADDCAALSRQAAGCGLRLGVLHNYESAPTWRAIAGELAAGMIGEPTTFEVRIADSGPLPGRMPQQPMWRTSRALAGAGCLLDQGYHYVYLAESLLGSRIVEVPAERIDSVTTGWDVEARAEVWFTHASEAVSHILID
jgi:predicted dehydrogenase